MVIDAVSVSDQSPDTDVSHEDAEIFEVYLNSAKLLFAGRTFVGLCMCVHRYLCDMVYTLMQQEVAVCQAPLISLYLYFHTVTLFQTVKITSLLRKYITFCILRLNLNKKTVQLQGIIKARNQWSQRTAVKTNNGRKTNVGNALPFPMGCFFCQPDGIKKKLTRKPLLTSFLL